MDRISILIVIKSYLFIEIIPQALIFAVNRSKYLNKTLKFGPKGLHVCARLRALD